MNVKQVVDSVIEAMSRRGFLKTIGKGAAVASAAPSAFAAAGQSSQYMRVPFDPHSAIESLTMPLQPYAMGMAEPFVGAVSAASGTTTSSGIIVTPTEILIPNGLFQSLNTAVKSIWTYKRPSTHVLLNDVGAQQVARNFMNNVNLWSRNVKEVRNKYRLAIDTHLEPVSLHPDHVDADFDDKILKLRAEEKAQFDRDQRDKAETEKWHEERRKKKEQQNKEKNAKYYADMARWGHSRMDYAGGSEDVQGEDYTTLESLTTKIIGLP